MTSEIKWGNLMEDIAPKLLAKIEQEFEEQFKADSLLAELAAKLEAGTATHTEAYGYAGRVGEILTDAYQHHISSSNLPDGKLWYNIANRVITPTMKSNYDIITRYVTDVQTNLNQAAGLGIKVLSPDMNVEDKIQGIVNRVSSENFYDDIQWILQEPVKTFGRNIVDASISANVDFHGKAGLKPKIVRKSSGNCCKWCMSLVGTYTYPDVPKDVYRRHDNCRCTVNYDPGKGKVQNVHSGKEGKRRYIQDGYGGYTKTKEVRIAYAKEMAATEEARKAVAREKRILTWERKKSGLEVEKSTENGTIKVIEVISGHDGTPKKSKPGDIIDHLGRDGKVETRTYYGEDSLKAKDITTHNHGMPKTHPYGINGEHAHDYEWDSEGKLKNKTTRNITEQERKENGDIL